MPKMHQDMNFFTKGKQGEIFDSVSRVRCGLQKKPRKSQAVMRSRLLERCVCSVAEVRALDA